MNQKEKILPAFDLSTVEHSIDTFDESFYKRAQWNEKFSFWPRQCDESKKLIWMNKAYQGKALWTGPGEDIIEKRWLTKESFIFGKLKGKI